MKSFKEIRDELADINCTGISKHGPDPDCNKCNGFKSGFDAADKLHREAAQGLIETIGTTKSFYHELDVEETNYNLGEIFKALESYYAIIGGEGEE
jgi:hypothetical protein